MADSDLTGAPSPAENEYRNNFRRNLLTLQTAVQLPGDGLFENILDIQRRLYLLGLPESERKIAVEAYEVSTGKKAPELIEASPGYIRKLRDDFEDMKKNGFELRTAHPQDARKVATSLKELTGEDFKVAGNIVKIPPAAFIEVDELYRKETTYHHRLLEVTPERGPVTLERGKTATFDFSDRGALGEDVILKPQEDNTVAVTFEAVGADGEKLRTVTQDIEVGNDPKPLSDEKGQIIADLKRDARGDVEFTPAKTMLAFDPTDRQRLQQARPVTVTAESGQIPLEKGLQFEFGQPKTRFTIVRVQAPNIGVDVETTSVNGKTTVSGKEIIMEPGKTYNVKDPGNTNAVVAKISLSKDERPQLLPRDSLIVRSINPQFEVLQELRAEAALPIAQVTLTPEGKVTPENRAIVKAAIARFAEAGEIGRAASPQGKASLVFVGGDEARKALGKVIRKAGFSVVDRPMKVGSSEQTVRVLQVAASETEQFDAVPATSGTKEQPGLLPEVKGQPVSVADLRPAQVILSKFVGSSGKPAPPSRPAHEHDLHRLQIAKITYLDVDGTHMLAFTKTRTGEQTHIDREQMENQLLALGLKQGRDFIFRVDKPHLVQIMNDDALAIFKAKQDEAVGQAPLETPSTNTFPTVTNSNEAAKTPPTGKKTGPRPT